MEQNPNLAALTNDSTLNPATPAEMPQAVSATQVAEAQMEPGTPPVDLGELSEAQIRALQTLAANGSLADAARSAGVAAMTLYRWRNDNPHFIVALNAWRGEVIASAYDRVLGLSDEAIRAALRLVRKDNPSVTIAILKALGALTHREPGTTDVNEFASNLRQVARKRAKGKWERLLSEAEQIRVEAQPAHWRRQRSMDQLRKTSALEETEPESVVREHRRADELVIEATGLPRPDDAVPGPAAANDNSNPAGM
jgi:hypothetical protein